MSDLFIKNIKELVQVRSARANGCRTGAWPGLENHYDAYLIIDGDNISAFGRMADLGKELES